MPNNAKCTIVGNLTQDPKENTVNGTTVVTFPVAVNTTKKVGDKYESDFYNLSVWGKTGEYIFPRLQKGTQVYATGDLVIQKYKDKSGVERQSLALRANDVVPLNRWKEANRNNNNGDDTDYVPF